MQFVPANCLCHSSERPAVACVILSDSEESQRWQGRRGTDDRGPGTVVRGVVIGGRGDRPVAPPTVAALRILRALRAFRMTGGVRSLRMT